MSQKNEIQEATRINALFERISELIEQARRRVVTTANIAEVYTKYSIGQYIVEDEQQGNARAEYGKQVLKDLSRRLTERFGDGWSYPTMKNIRQFYMVYSKGLTSGEPIQLKKANQRLPKSDSANADAEIDKQRQSIPAFTLSWSHYLILMRIENPDARRMPTSMQPPINSICPTRPCCKAN